MHCCSAVDSLCDVLKGFPASVGAESRELEGNGARVLACIQYILLLWKKTLCHVAARRRCMCDEAVQRFKCSFAFVYCREFCIGETLTGT